MTAPSSEPHGRNDNENGNIPPAERSENVDANGSYGSMGNSFPPNHPGRRHQLYVGNLTWVCVYIGFIHSFIQEKKKIIRKKERNILTNQIKSKQK